jgi:hypothetical protein
MPAEGQCDGQREECLLVIVVFFFVVVVTQVKTYSTMVVVGVSWLFVWSLFSFGQTNISSKVNAKPNGLYC